MSKHWLTELWSKTLAILEDDLNHEIFDIWFKPTEPVFFDGKQLIVMVPNEFAQNYLRDRYYTLIKNTLQLLLNQDVIEVEFILPEDKKDWVQPDYTPIRNDKTANNSFPAKQGAVTQLNPRYTFNSFVVGNSNRFAHAACLAVAETPAEAYNPLFIYGGVGLGKTHLMHAIGHMILNRNPNTRVLYVSSETFVNELINSIKDDETEQFRNRYRNIDVLLIDDIQFLAKKERTQEEFFHTFNALYEANKQIVISSDRTPKEIPTLEDRLRSRFEWGLITDIQPPDFETRVAILRKKAEQDNLNLSDEVMSAIAAKIQSNIRELEGALIRVAAYASLENKTIDSDFIEEALKDLIPNSPPKEITIDLIQQCCAEFFNLKVDDLKAKKRTRSVAWPRQIAMYLSRELTDASLPKIGEEFGGRDHTTVLHAYEKVAQQLEQDQNLVKTINSLKEKITS